VTDFLNELNPVQRQAVENTNGSSLVIAGAGSGKTRVLTYKITYLLSKGIQPSTILALTFTNKAAKEMKERISKLVGETKAKYLWMGTFHAIFAKILRQEADKIGFPSAFTIYDTLDSKSLIKTIVKEFKLDPATYKEGDVLHRISMAKNSLVTPQTYESNPEYYQNDISNKKPEIARIYKSYANRCKQAGAMDFDDLLLMTNILFRDHKAVLSKYQEKFKYILVDEYQDTNFSQYLILRKLSEIHKNICVVGDDAQSIYSFRGAKIENILNFQRDYPENKVFKLEQNYRSTQTIVNAANSVIAKNERQIQKNVFSTNPVGELIKITETFSDQEEAMFVANSIADIRLREHFDFKDFAILYRTNAQSRTFEEAFRRRSIPYKIHGGMSFYQRKEIKDIIGYFRIVVNNKDDEAIRRIINYPRRGIGDSSIVKIEEYASVNQLTLWETITMIQKIPLGLGSGVVTKISQFIATINSFIAKLETEDAYQLAKEIASSSGILKELYDDKSVEGISRYENLQELLNGIKEFSEQKDRLQTDLTLSNFLQEVSLLTSEDNDKDEDRNKVILMTIHSAKGLEFKSVFIVGVEEGLFPSQMAAFSQQDIEEERRLFYVAVTRAEKYLSISSSKTRYRWGQLVECRPSRFVKEIDIKFTDTLGDTEQDDLNEENNINNFENKFSGRKFEKANNSEANTPTLMKNSKSTRHSFDPMPANKKLVRLDSQPEIPVQNNPENGLDNNSGRTLKIGMQVEHQRFGYGKIIALEGEYPDMKAIIAFQKSGEKQLLLKFAKLRIIS